MNASVSSFFRFLLIFLVFGDIVEISGSPGDKSPYYQNCVLSCHKQKCQNNILLYKKGYEESFTHRLLDIWRKQKFDVASLENLVRWNCRDECKYHCMHQTTEAFLKRKWPVHQFHGKWPFIRIFGLQEPASVIFSALNLYIHYHELQKFRRNVHSDSPLYAVWHTFSFICMNAWVWSIVFHTRDYAVTELFDYIFAYSMVLASFWCFIIRVLYGRSKKIVAFVTFLCMLFFFNHFAYLSYNYSFDYTYNMKVNVCTGAIGGIGWIVWCFSEIRTRPYVWKMLVFVILALATTGLEVYDFPPIFQTLDAHSLWHLSSAPITIIFYRFITEDCIQLRKEMIPKEDKRKLL